MEIRKYHPDYLHDLTRLYRELTSPIPYCHSIDANELAQAFAGDCGYESFGERLIRDEVFVALDGSAIGFVHVGEGRLDERDAHRPQGIIRFLAYPRGRRDVGQALLNRAEKWLRDGGLDSALIYRQAYRYPFYHFSHAYLSDRLEHIQALLLFNGYQVCGGEVFLDWPNMDPNLLLRVPTLDIDLEINHESGQGRLPDIKLRAFHSGQEVGECICLSAATFSKQAVVEEWIFTQWLGISEPYQGRGLGRHLLGHALVEAQKVGYRHAAISTALDNYRALLFYANCGYHAVDWTRQFFRQLSNS